MTMTCGGGKGSVAGRCALRLLTETVSLTEKTLGEVNALKTHLISTVSTIDSLLIDKVRELGILPNALGNNLSQINSRLVTSNLLAVNKISDKVLLSAISDLSKLDQHKLLKLPVGGFEKGHQGGGGLGGNVYPVSHSEGLPRLPVTVGDDGVRVGIFSTGDQGSGGSLLGLISPEKHDSDGGGSSAAKLQGTVSGVTGTVSNTVGGTVNTVHP